MMTRSETLQQTPHAIDTDLFMVISLSSKIPTYLLFFALLKTIMYTSLAVDKRAQSTSKEIGCQ